VVDNFDGDFACRRWIKGAARGGIKSGPRSLVDFRTQSAFQFLVGLIGSREVGMADKEALVLQLKSAIADLYRPISFDFLAHRESEKEAFTPGPRIRVRLQLFLGQSGKGLLAWCHQAQVHFCNALLRLEPLYRSQ